MKKNGHHKPKPPPDPLPEPVISTADDGNCTFSIYAISDRTEEEATWRVSYNPDRFQYYLEHAAHAYSGFSEADFLLRGKRTSFRAHKEACEGANEKERGKK